MSEIIFSETANQAIQKAVALANDSRHEFVMPEHLLMALLEDKKFQNALSTWSDIEVVDKELRGFLNQVEKVPDNFDYDVSFSDQLQQLLNICLLNLQTSSAREIDVPHLVNAMFQLPDSKAVFILRNNLDIEDSDFICELLDTYDFTPGNDDMVSEANLASQSPRQEPKKEKGPDWKLWAVCMNQCCDRRNPLIGREDELERTIRVLCRKDKNNPLHVGEPGVGKTALVWGLARRINEGLVPQRLKGSKIYKVDLSSVLAGTQFRGDFEKRLKQIINGVMKEGRNNIIYIDEIHTLVGAGATGDGAMDAANILKPYLESGLIRFIGSTTYDDFNRYLSRSKSLLRRFQQIDIEQPSVEETKHIIRQLKPIYEEFHGIAFSSEGIDFAVEASARHITERFLPDKAIDLIDEAGAAMEMAGEKSTVGVKEIADVLARICKVDALAVAEKDDYDKLENLTKRMKALIYGQDSAVEQVVESVQMSRAGLLDDRKPLASLLFVGPTGVGKTEVARVLADKLGVELIRFDMSEYVEKHSVAKLIGAPAGYVGYDDGGLLTDAIRKSPNCVLLLDEIEKAHEDIYNILLQVMDYARLTDNKGRQADFRNVILIMTSNAGARFASMSSLGFASTSTRGGAMMKQVKKTFRPEFLNRLSGTVVFNDMDRNMASLILKKKLRELERKLDARNVTLSISQEAFDFLLDKGFTAEYGAREMDRVIRRELNPPLMREILFGSLKSGGKAEVALTDGSLSLSNIKPI